MTADLQGVVTTAARPNPELLHRAGEIARRLGLPLVSRDRRTLDEILAEYAASFSAVATREGTFLYADGRQYRYHPGMAVVRLRQVIRGHPDPLLEVGEVRPGDRVVDATLGLGADAIVLSHAVGPEGRVVGVEDRPVVAFFVEEGLSTYAYPALPELEAAMRRVEVVWGDHVDYLRRLPDRSVDLVYFDPMFRKTISASRGIDALRVFGDPSALRFEAVKEAVRVARRRVVLKDRRDGGEIDRLGFQPVPKGSGRIQFGVIDVGGGK